MVSGAVPCRPEISGIVGRRRPAGRSRFPEKDTEYASPCCNFRSGAGSHRGLRDRLRADHSDHPGRLDHSGRGGQILDDEAPGQIPESGQDLQDRMVAVQRHLADDVGDAGRRARLRDAGRAADRAEHGGRQSRHVCDRPACRRAAGQLLGLLGGEGRLADQDGRRPEGQDRRHLGDRRRHARRRST